MPVNLPLPATWRGAQVQLLLALGLVLAVATTGIAFAHANLARSEPAANAVLDSPPSLLKLWFTEGTEPRFAEVRITDNTGRRIQGVGALRSESPDNTLLAAQLPELPKGVYTVSWRALSVEDGHVVSGSFAFAVRGDQLPPGGFRSSSGADSAGTSTATPVGVLIRWIGYLGLAVLFGGFLFVPLVLNPALESAGVRPRSQVPSGSKRARAKAQRALSEQPPHLLPLLVGSWCAAMSVTLVGVVAQAAGSAGVEVTQALGAPLATLLFNTRYGTLFWARLLQLGLVGGLLFFIYRQVRRGEPIPDWWWWLGADSTAGVLLIISMGSHAAATPGPLLAIGVDWLHLMAAGLWTGGLVSLFVAVAWLRRSLKAGSSVAISAAVNRFSQLATLSVMALGATGTYRAVQEIQDGQNLLDTYYGLALLAKLGLIVPLLALGAVNLLLLKRRLQTGSLAADAGAGSSWHGRLRQTVGGGYCWCLRCCW